MMKRGKKGQVMGMPFQFIIAIILIAITIFVGFFVIKMFLERAEQMKFNTFVQEIRGETIQIWQAEEADEQVEIPLTKNIDYVCFLNTSKPSGCISPNFLPTFCQEISVYDKTSNMFFYPLNVAEKYGTKSDWHIQCGTDAMTKECIDVFQNPTCILLSDGIAKLKMAKASGMSSVTVSKA